MPHPTGANLFSFATLVEHFNQAPEPLEGCSPAFDDIVHYLDLARAKVRPQFKGVARLDPGEIGRCYTTYHGSEAVGYTVYLDDSCLKRQPLPVIIATLAHEACHALVSELGLSRPPRLPETGLGHGLVRELRGVESEETARLNEEQLVDAAVCTTGMAELYIQALRSSAAYQLGYFSRAAFEALWLRMSSKHSGSAR